MGRVIADRENYNKMINEKIVMPYSLNESSDEESNNKNYAMQKYSEKDMATILVNLYGSQEAFIAEYQNMLAEKILATT